MNEPGFFCFEEEVGLPEHDVTFLHSLGEGFDSAKPTPSFPQVLPSWKDGIRLPKGGALGNGSYSAPGLAMWEKKPKRNALRISVMGVNEIKLAEEEEHGEEPWSLAQG